MIGIAIGIFFGVLVAKILPKCKGDPLAKTDDEFVSRNKRLKLNHGLSNSSLGRSSSESKKYVYGGSDDTVPSEEFRDLAPGSTSKRRNKHQRTDARSYLNSSAPQSTHYTYNANE